MRFMSPLAAVLIVTLIGLGLFYLGVPGIYIVAKYIEIGLPALIILLFLSQYIPHVIKSTKVSFDRFTVLFTVTIVWLYIFIFIVGGAYRHSSLGAQFTCRTDWSGLIGAAPWIRIPYPFQWGTPTFNVGEAFAMMAASIASLIETTGTFIAVQRYSSATPVPPSIFSRGIGWLGIGVLLDGIFGTTTGSATSVENAGLLGLTRLGSRRVIMVAAGFMIFFSLLGKFGAVFASIPIPIFAALYSVADAGKMIG